MHDLGRVWAVGWLATATATTSTALNALIAFNLSSSELLMFGLRILLFISFGISIAGAIAITYFTCLYPRNVILQNLGDRISTWGTYSAGIITALVSLALQCASLIWLVTQRQSLPSSIYQRPSASWVIGWFGVWAGLVLFESILFLVLGLWTRSQLRMQSAGRVDLDFGIASPAMGQLSDTFVGHSRDTTLGSFPKTPSSTHVGSVRSPSITKANTVNPRTKIMSKGSSRSSLDQAGHAPGDGVGVDDNAFDTWDTSSVQPEFRAAVASSPVVASKPTLETIPGSRAASPANALDGPWLPSSPQGAKSKPVDLATLPSSASAIAPSSKNPLATPPSTPVTTPPNFSRPTSQHQIKRWSATVEATMQLIHPLFRATSPQPPPVATGNTNISVSPVANDPITPRTLSRLRSIPPQKDQSRTSKSSGQWRTMPSLDAYTQRPSTACSASSPPSSPGLGSPGPSIYDDSELRPVIPGFILAAGNRSSLLGYKSRKSLRRDNRRSQLSVT